MSAHQHESNADELWEYFNKVIEMGTDYFSHQAQIYERCSMGRPLQ